MRYHHQQCVLLYVYLKVFDSEIKEKFPAGPGARESALEAEKENAERLKKEGQLKYQYFGYF